MKWILNIHSWIRIFFHVQHFEIKNKMVEKSILEYDIKLPLSGVKLEAPNTRFFINEKECGKGGLLCVAERYVLSYFLDQVI